MLQLRRPGFSCLRRQVAEAVSPFYFYVISIAKRVRVQKNHRESRGGFLLKAFLGERHVLGARAFLALSNLERNDVTNLKLIERYSVQILGMKEKILRLAFASDKPESSVHERFNCSSHSFYFTSQKSDHIS